VVFVSPKILETLTTDSTDPSVGLPRSRSDRCSFKNGAGGSLTTNRVDFRSRHLCDRSQPVKNPHKAYHFGVAPDSCAATITTGC
jgi:hypothetical protein